MGETASAWWLGADRQWRKGEPPPGWWQARDGRWHPPTDQPTTAELPAVGDAGPGDVTGRFESARRARHLAGRDDSRDVSDEMEPDPRWPAWRRVAAPVAAVVLTLALIAMLIAFAGQTPSDDRAGGLGPAPGRPGPSQPFPPPSAATTGAPGPSQTPVATATTAPPSTASSTTTTKAPEPPESGPPAPPPGDPFALCDDEDLGRAGPGERPWAWYLAHFDRDGNGILCD